MAAQRKARAPAIHRRRARRPGVGLAVGGCILFGLGVVVGAFLGPLARPKKTASPPETTRVLSSAAPSKKTASKETRSRDAFDARKEELRRGVVLATANPDELGEGAVTDDYVGDDGAIVLAPKCQWCEYGGLCGATLGASS